MSGLEQPWVAPLGGPSKPAAGAKSAPVTLQLRALAGLVLGYAGLAGLSMLLSRQAGSIAMVWYANALAVVVLARAPRRHWPVLGLGVAVANAAVNRLWGDGWLTALAMVPPNLLEIGLAAWALQRTGLVSSGLRTPPAVLRLLALCAVLPAAAAALLAAGLLAALGLGPALAVGQGWYLSAVIGAVSALPLLLLLANQAAVPLRQALLNPRVGLLLPLAVITTVLCLAWVPFPFVYLGVPLLVAAMLVDLVVVALLVLVVSVTVTLALAAGLFLPPAVGLSPAAFVYLALAAALVLALLLAATMADLRDSQARLLAGKAALRQANAGLQQFVHMASHDLREPINAIEQFSGLIELDHGQHLPEPARGYLALVRHEAGRLRALLDDVLQYSQVQRGDLPAPQPVALDAVMAGVRQALDSKLRETGARLQVALLPVVLGHATLLALLLQHLLDNALTYVTPGQVPEVWISASEADGMVWLSVTDRGIGIPADQQARLFAPFQRLHRRRDYDGTGLGLALCRQIARAHGGEIGLQSTPGEGSRFTVHLPLSSPLGLPPSGSAVSALDAAQQPGVG